MLNVTDTASAELNKVLAQDMAAGKYLVIYFQGYGWSGPVLGMALDESTNGLEKMESNGIMAYIDPGLHQSLQQVGNIVVDYQDHGAGGSGFTIRVGEPGDCSGGCSSCG